MYSSCRMQRCCGMFIVAVSKNKLPESRRKLAGLPLQSATIKGLFMAGPLLTSIADVGLRRCWQVEARSRGLCLVPSSQSQNPMSESRSVSGCERLSSPTIMPCNQLCALGSTITNIVVPYAQCRHMAPCTSNTLQKYTCKYLGLCVP